MPKRNLHIVNPSNPLFGICERCHARFTSFAYNAQQADREVHEAFDRHECQSPQASVNLPGTSHTEQS